MAAYQSMSITRNVIVDLSTRYGQTHEMKREINNSSTYTGHGSILLGSSARLEGGEGNIRMLVGAHFSRHGSLKIGTFGGKCDGSEITLDTVIRETIEEVFNIPTSDRMVKNIRDYLNTNTDLYYIYQASRRSTAYCYIFDVNILGEFVRIMNELNEPRIFVTPTDDCFTNINQYVEYTRTGITFNVVKFIKERYISHKTREIYRRLHVHQHSGLNEIKYLSFVTLSKLVAASHNRYRLFNFKKHRREDLEMQYFLVKLLETDIMSFTLHHQ